MHGHTCFLSGATYILVRSRVTVRRALVDFLGGGIMYFDGSMTHPTAHGGSNGSLAVPTVLRRFQRLYDESNRSMTCQVFNSMTVSIALTLPSALWWIQRVHDASNGSLTVPTDL